VLLAEGGVAKLADFGAAGRLQGELTLPGEFCSTHGTPAFMAPEVC
jgi:serine/threonine protein kinase